MFCILAPKFIKCHEEQADHGEQGGSTGSSRGPPPSPTVVGSLSGTVQSSVKTVCLRSLLSTVPRPEGQDAQKPPAENWGQAFGCAREPELCREHGAEGSPHLRDLSVGRGAWKPGSAERTREVESLCRTKSGALTGVAQ